MLSPPPTPPNCSSSTVFTPTTCLNSRGQKTIHCVRNALGKTHGHHPCATKWRETVAGFPSDRPLGTVDTDSRRGPYRSKADTWIKLMHQHVQLQEFRSKLPSTRSPPSFDPCGWRRSFPRCSKSSLHRNDGNTPLQLCSLHQALPILRLQVCLCLRGAAGIATLQKGPSTITLFLGSYPCLQLRSTEILKSK